MHVALVSPVSTVVTVIAFILGFCVAVPSAIESLQRMWDSDRRNTMRRIYLKAVRHAEPSKGASFEVKQSWSALQRAAATVLGEGRGFFEKHACRSDEAVTTETDRFAEMLCAAIDVKPGAGGVGIDVHELSADSPTVVEFVECVYWGIKDGLHEFSSDANWITTAKLKRWADDPYFARPNGPPDSQRYTLKDAARETKALRRRLIAVGAIALVIVAADKILVSNQSGEGGQPRKSAASTSVNGPETGETASPLAGAARAKGDGAVDVDPPRKANEPGAILKKELRSKDSNVVAEIEFCRVPAGRDQYGIHRNGFWLSQTEVTQRQWKAIGYQIEGNDNPSVHQGDDLPVNGVNWHDVQGFLQQARAEGFPLRLPLDTEWEYAARAGTTTLFYTGDDEGALAQAAWYKGNSLVDYPHVVGPRLPKGEQRKPNAWGLHDMYGNIGEWVDSHEPLGDNAKIKGGCLGWSLDTGFFPPDRHAGFEKATNRATLRYIGFRVVLESPSEDGK